LDNHRTFKVGGKVNYTMCDIIVTKVKGQGHKVTQLLAEKEPNNW